MLLDKNAITQNNIVSNPSVASQRETTYDATVGEILFKGQVLPGQSHILEPRGVVWVISAEQFTLPLTVTGLATLKTTWTHEGVLALNVGVIDPGWTGPVATALVNFSKRPFIVRKGDPFFRILFHEHAQAATSAHSPASRDTYVKGICEKSLKFSDTFLDMTSLASEVADEVLRFPRWANRLAIAALIATVAAIFVPICIQVWTESRSANERIAKLEVEVETLSKDSPGQARPAPSAPPSKTREMEMQPSAKKAGVTG
ncbi:hypothetical protein PXJ20_02110 [Paraburkholderia sp. A1RI_3L]|uniref:dCTP deaminase domain-containing protein n=1 Tax=Paraburkholderia TaxID=1822464 RepID=UPI003B783A85